MVIELRLILIKIDRHAIEIIIMYCHSRVCLSLVSLEKYLARPRPGKWAETRPVSWSRISTAGTSPHQVLATTLTLLQPGGKIMPTAPYSDVSTKFWKPQVGLQIIFYLTWIPIINSRSNQKEVNKSYSQIHFRTEMEANVTNQALMQSCHGFPVPQLWTLLAIGAIGLFFNATSVFHLMKNFTLKKSIHQVLLIDSVICTISSLVLIVVASTYLVFPAFAICGQFTCYLIQLAVLIPFWLGHTFVFQIALHRNIAAASNANQDQPLTQERQHRHKIYITTIAIVYLTIVLSLSGLDGIVHQVRDIFKLRKAMKSSPLLGPFYGSESWGFSLLKI